MLSHRAPGLCRGAKCFPNLGNDFTRMKSAFPTWETILQRKRMEQKNKIFNLGTFFCLYIAQTIPMSFFSTVIPVMMRQENFSLSAIGLLQLIKLPWILKFLWSPMVDRHARTTGDYKRWIFSSELIYAVLIFAVAFLDFKTDFYTIIALIIVSFVASATQDIATDALAVLSFSRKDKSLVNSMQSMGSFGGSMIGGGVLLLLFKQLGWNSLLPCVALFVIVALLPLLFNRGLEIAPKDTHERAKKADVFYFFTQKNIWKQIGFLFLYYSGLIGTLAMLKPRPGILDERDRGDERCDRDLFRVHLFFCRGLYRAPHRTALGTHPVCRVCIACHALFPRIVLCHSDTRTLACRHCPALGQLWDGDDRGLYNGDGLCSSRTGRHGLYDTDGYNPSERNGDGDIERKDCRPYRLPRLVFL